MVLLTIYRRTRVKSGIFGQTAKFGQPPCLFHSLIIGIKNKSTQQTVEILMRRLRAVSSGFPLFANVCPNLPDVRSYPTLPYGTFDLMFTLDMWDTIPSDKRELHVIIAQSRSSFI